MNRYWLFGGENYYAKGGMHDFIVDLDELERLKEQASFLHRNTILPHGYEIEWWHIVDIENIRVVAGTMAQAWGADDIIDMITKKGCK